QQPSSNKHYHEVHGRRYLLRPSGHCYGRIPRGLRWPRGIWRIRWLRWLRRIRRLWRLRWLRRLRLPGRPRLRLPHAHQPRLRRIRRLRPGRTRLRRTRILRLSPRLMIGSNGSRIVSGFPRC
ncbi:unnamed protein product, partial [Ixodes persulcatus]